MIALLVNDKILCYTSDTSLSDMLCLADKIIAVHPDWHYQIKSIVIRSEIELKG